MSFLDENKLYMHQLQRFQIVLTAEKIASFINYCEDKDDAFFMEFEQILKNAEITGDPCTLPRKPEVKHD